MSPNIYYNDDMSITKYDAAKTEGHFLGVELVREQQNCDMSTGVGEPFWADTDLLVSVCQRQKAERFGREDVGAGGDICVGPEIAGGTRKVNFHRSGAFMDGAPEGVMAELALEDEGAVAGGLQPAEGAAAQGGLGRAEGD